ncbi:protein BIG GRAIN 1-like A [Rhodamnia argentea]|uniref:Protein BIG GRAIN 1-like A n=1 Tax=Rhodamnia argentea TaxID=178133 RepID=A0A8B8P5N6_9MYRT|nr:protein BIG GRAIN 1-like A [Rhodamnia argentea]
MNKRERPLREAAAAAAAVPPTVPQRRKTPSFSSSLLDSIYRSIDEPSGQDQASPLFPEPPLIKKQSTHKTNHGASLSSSSSSSSYSQRELSNLRRAIMVEEWMEKQSSRNSSDSSSAATFSTFSSSEAESTHRAKQRTLEDRKSGGDNAGGFSKTKLRALKLYGELKKVKQPISPGGRITSFLNSIFNSGNVKKAKMCHVGAVEDVSFERKPKSACSSASSFSRSCMSKTPSARSKLKRSVRFYPMSVIVGEDSQPCGHKCIYDNDRKAKNGGGGGASAVSQREREARVEAERERYFQKKMDARGSSKNRVVVRVYSDEDDDDDDVESDASSDLFELDHLIGLGRYGEELPVYETTCLKKNQAIAHGLIL